MILLRKKQQSIEFGMDIAALVGMLIRAAQALRNTEKRPFLFARRLFEIIIINRMLASRAIIAMQSKLTDNLESAILVFVETCPP